MRLVSALAWTWLGFLADPAPAPAPPPAPAPAPAPRLPARPVTWFVPAEGRWHGRDRAGVEWAHPDRAALEAFLANP